MAKDGFTQMIDDSNAFFIELRENNNKAWFDPRKAYYTENIKKPAEFFADLLADDLSRIAGRTMKPKVFRIYRDVRFSKDKTPLNAHLHILWSPVTDNPFAPFYFFGSEPGSMSLGFGVPSLKGPDMARYRAFVDALGAQFQDALDQAGMTWTNWGGEPLKRVPKPYDQDHPHADLLKRKSLIMHIDMPPDWREAEGGLVSAVRAGFQSAAPVRDLFEKRLAADA